MTLKVPVTASDIVAWVRLCANTANELVRRLGDLTKRVDTAEGNISTLQTDMAAAQTDISALQVFAASPFTVDSITFTPQALPGTPTNGLTLLDSADSVLKIYVGGAWHSLF